MCERKRGFHRSQSKGCRENFSYFDRSITDYLSASQGASNVPRKYFRTFSSDLTFPPRSIALGSTQPVTKCPTRNFLGRKVRPALRGDILPS